MKPLVSVIIPFYNNIEELKNAIDSVLIQTYKIYEIIIIDDCSSVSLDQLKLYLINKNIKYFRNNSNKGPGYSRNKGIEMSNGEYLAFLDSDDTWMTNKLEIQLNFMQTNNYFFSHTSYVRNNKVGGNIKKMNSGFINYIYPIPLFFCRIATPTVMIKKSSIKDNNFDTKLRFLEDTFLWYQISKKTTLKGLNLYLTKVNVSNQSSYLQRNKIKESYQIILKKIKNEHKLLYIALKLYLLVRY